MADMIKGITIEIGGNTAPLSKALGEVNKESRNIQSELKQVEKLLKFDPSNTELIAQKQKLLADAVNSAKNKVDALRQAQEEVNKKVASGEIDKGSAEYRNLQRQVIEAEQALNKAEKAQNDFGNKCKDAGKDAKTAGENAEKAGKQAKGSGDNAKEGGNGWQKFGELASKAGKIAIGAVTTVAAGATASGKAVWDMAKQTAEATDEIDKQSQAFGLSREAYQEYSYILSQNGMDISALSGVSKTLTAQMDKVTEGNKAATANFEKLGLSVYDANGKLKSQEQMLAESINALQGMEDGTEKARLAQELFGKQGQALMPMLNGAAGSVDELRQKAHDLGMVMSDEAVDAGVEFTDSLDTLKRTGTGLKNNIMSNMLPGLTQLTKGFTTLISGGAGADKTIKEAVKNILASFSGIVPQFLGVIQILITTILSILPDILSMFIQSILEFAPELVSALLEVVQSIVASITDNIDLLINAVIEIMTMIASFIIENIPLLVDAGLQIITALLEGITEAIPTIIQAIVDLIPKLIQAITDNLPTLINAGITLILALVNGLIAAIPQLLDALPKIIDALLNGILGAIPQIINAGIQLLTALVTALPEIISKIVEVLPEIITSIIDALLENLPLIVQAGIDLLIAIVEDLPTIILTIVNAIPEIVTSICDALIDNIDSIIDAGVTLLIAMVENTPKIISEIIKAIPRIVSGIVDAIIKCVPKLASAGLELIKGLWNGISDAGEWLWDKISGFFDGVLGKIKNFFGIASPSKLFRDMIGKNLVKGIAVGVDIETPNLQKNLEDNLSAATDGLKASVDAGNIDIGTGISGDPSGVSKLGGIHFEIGTFVNNTDRDFESLIEEAMEVAEDYVRRRQGVFA